MPERDEWLTTRRRASEPAAVVGSVACVGRMPSPRRTLPREAFPERTCVGIERGRVGALGGGQVGQRSGGAGGEGECLHGCRRADGESPVAGGVAECARDASSRLHVEGGEPARGAGRQRETNLGGVACVVAGSDGHCRGFGARVGQPKDAWRVRLCAGEQRDRSAAVGGFGHSGELAPQAFRRLCVCGYVEFRRRADDEAPVALAGADASGQALDGVALLDVGGGELCCVSRFDGQGDWAEAAAGVVEGGDGDDGGSAVVTGQPENAALRRLAGG